MLEKLQKKQGGASVIDDIKSYDDLQLFQQIRLEEFEKLNRIYTNQIEKNEQYDSNNNKVSTSMNEEIEKIIKARNTDQLAQLAQLAETNGFKKLFDIILANKNTEKKFQKDFIIPKIKYDTSDYKFKVDNNYNFSKFTTYYDYNKFLILSFESGLIKFMELNHYDDYIANQTRFLATLTRKELNIIKDYTNPNTFDYINAFKRRQQVPTIEFTERHNNIGNSFSDLIHARISILRRQNTNNEDNLNVIDSFENNRKKLPVEGFYHPIYKLLTPELWFDILTDFLKKLNDIIKKAPAVTKPLILYRGSSSHYKNDSSNPTMYVSREISSYTMNYEACKFFYEIGNGFANENALIYRVYVKPGVRLLFTTPLVINAINNELEFITQVGQKFSIDRAYSDSYDNLNVAYNNINMTNNLLLDERNKFRTHKFIVMEP